MPPAPRRRRGNTLERWEVALVKAMLERGTYNDQDVLAYFTRPTRSINHRVISEIRNGAQHRNLRPSSEEELDAFLISWPAVDPQTGLSLRGDELLIKAREAMIAAVHTFNGAGLTFRAELFVVTSIIAWTYMLHAYYRREGVDYRYYRNQDGVREIERTQAGAEKYWELSKCLNDNRSPIENTSRKNLEFLIELRHEIEHRSTNRIDDAVSAKLQACCINFNETIKTLFGKQYGLEARLPLALQFVTFSSDQGALLKAAGDLPTHIETMMDAFHGGLTADEQADPRFAYRVAFVQKTANRAGSSDLAIEFVRPDSDEAAEINRVLLKETEKSKYRPTKIVLRMQEEGYPRFTISKHTDLWKALDAKAKGKGYGVQMLDGQWYWYDTWLNRVQEHCCENSESYGAP